MYLDRLRIPIVGQLLRHAMWLKLLVKVTLRPLGDLRRIDVFEIWCVLDTMLDPLVLAPFGSRALLKKSVAAMESKVETGSPPTR